MKPRLLFFLLLATSTFATEAPPPLWAQMQAAALTKPDIAEVRRILDLGFDPNGSIGCGDWPALMGAVQRRDVEMARLLLERGAKVPDQAMLTACRTHDMELTLIKLLVAHGGNVNAKEAHSTCLHAATWYKNRELAGFLAKAKGIDLNVVCHDGPDDGTPLMWALKIGATDVANLLLAAGANPAIKGETGATAATIVAERMRAYEKLRRAVGAEK